MLADHVPPGSRLVLAGRDEPPLRVARLRAEGRLLEIGSADLALDQAEAAALLRAAEVTLGDDDVAVLHRRTEGWPAGLYLAALYLREGGPLGSAAVSFAGDDRLVSEYMEAEFLARISRRHRVFLTRTAVLERMCGPLCEAVLQEPGRGRSWPTWPGRTCCWCRWTGAVTGTATITCSGTCCWPTWNAPSPACCRCCGGARRPGAWTMTGRRSRWSTPWPPGTLTRSPGSWASSPRRRSGGPGSPLSSGGSGGWRAGTGSRDTPGGRVGLAPGRADGTVG